MKTKCLKALLTVLLIGSSLYGQGINYEVSNLGTSSNVIEDNTSELINYLSSLSQNFNNDLFTYHCNSIINIIRAKGKPTSYEIPFINKMFSTFTDTTVSWNASLLSSYLERKRPFIISWISPTDSAVSLAWLVPPINWDPGKMYPLYTSLHGLYNSYANRIEFMSTYLSPKEILNQSFDDGFLVYPWGRGNLWYEGVSETDIWEAVNTVESLVKIDSSKEYLVGHSMGGYGAWMLGQKAPEKWAAIGIYAGCWWSSRIAYLTSTVAEKLKNVPVYIVCGTDDPYINDNRKAYSLLRSAGNPDIFLVTFPGGHDPLPENWQNMYEWIRQRTKKHNTAVDSYEPKLNTYMLNNYPNPFNPVTTIVYNLSLSGHVELTVLDILGREVKSLVNEEQNAGRYEVKFSAGSGGDGGNLSSGVYFYRIKVGSFSETKKFVLLK